MSNASSVAPRTCCNFQVRLHQRKRVCCATRQFVWAKSPWEIGPSWTLWSSYSSGRFRSHPSAWMWMKPVSTKSGCAPPKIFLRSLNCEKLCSAICRTERKWFGLTLYEKSYLIVVQVNGFQILAFKLQPSQVTETIPTQIQMPQRQNIFHRPLAKR